MFKRPGSIFSGLLAVALVIPLCLSALAQQPNTENELKSAADKNEKIHGKIFPSFVIRTIPDTLAKTTGDVTITTDSDLEVGVVHEGTEPLYPPSRLADLACFTDAVVLASPVKGVSHMTSDETFIYSEWTMHIEEVLQDTPKAPIGGKETITVVRPGGKLIIDGRAVYGKAYDFPEFRPDAKYLLFLTYIPETGAFKARTERTFSLTLDPASAVKQHPYGDSHKADPVMSGSPEELVRDARAAVAYEAGKGYCKKRGDE